MLFITIFIILTVVSLESRINVNLSNRITCLGIFYATILSYNCLNTICLGHGLSIYSGLFQTTTLSLSAELLISFIACLALIPWSPNMSHVSSKIPVELIPNNHTGTTSTISPVVEYGIITLFSLTGSIFLVSSADLVSIYLGIELQSFAVYVLAAIYRDSIGATASGLKYFLLGGLSSCFILLGAALIYSSTGLTNLDNIYAILSSKDLIDIGLNSCVLGIILLTCGLLFKVASAPFHNWAPDVYDGVPTIVTTWLAILPKLSILTLFLELVTGFNTNGLQLNDYDVLRGLFLICSFLSLIIGTVVGLSQWRIKRLLTYSTISHIGFILLALSITGSESTSAFTFYITQYTITAIAIFFVLLSLGYSSISRLDIESFDDLRGRFSYQPLLLVSISVCVLSIAGIPPLLGFFGKLSVLSATIEVGNLFMAIVAIIVSVISASYYLKFIRVGHFESFTIEYIGSITTTSIHSYVISILTLSQIFYIVIQTTVIDSFNCLAIAFNLY